jgi:hypothetical protein
MHRKERRAFPGNVEIHLVRLRELDRHSAEQGTVPVAQSIPTPANPAAPVLDYDHTKRAAPWKRIAHAVSVALDETLGITLLCAIFAFFLGFLFPYHDGLVLPLYCGGFVVVIGMLWTFLEVRRHLCRSPSNT